MMKRSDKELPESEVWCVCYEDPEGGPFIARVTGGYWQDHEDDRVDVVWWEIAPKPLETP